MLETQHSGHVEACIAENTGGRLFEEDGNNKTSTKKGRHNSKSKSRKPSSVEVFYSLSEMSTFALK